MNDYICKSCYLNQHVVVVAIENNQSSQKEIINLIELFIKNLLEEMQMEYKKKYMFILNI